MNSKILITSLLLYISIFANTQDCEIIELSIANVSCPGASDGKIVLDNTTSCLPPVTYEWAHGDTGSAIYNLSAGLYELTLTDATGFELYKNWSITEPDEIVLDPFISDVVCNGESNGSISLFVFGGNFPYTYEWSNGAMESYLFDLSGGDYSVTVEDANGCSAFGMYTVVDPDPVGVETVLFDNISCAGENDGHIIVNGTGGTLDSGTSTGEYYYEWSTGEIDVTELDNLSPGTYTVTVSDIYGCTGSKSYVVFEPSEIFVTFPQITDLTCNGDATGEVSIFASGGTGILDYSWSNGESGNTISNLQAGNYTLTITDENECIFIDTYTVNEPAPIAEVPADVFDLLCFEDGTGEIEIFISGGTGNLDYLWSNGATSNDIANLQAGTYSVTVTDENGCTLTNSYTINQPLEFVIDEVSIVDVDCNGNTNGSIAVFLAGGTPTYSYQWSTGSTFNTISNLGPGNYSLTATDGNECSIEAEYTILEPASLEIVLGEINDVDCNGNETGSIVVTTTGGSPGYTYSWSNGATTNTNTDLEAGMYTVTVTDENGCSATATYTVDEPASLEIVLGEINDVDCNGNETGSIVITTTGGSPGYTYSWTNGATSNTNTDLEAGMYTVTVTDENGCSATATYTVDEPVSLEIVLGEINDVDCNGNETGSIVITTTGGSPGYTYSWSNGATSNTNTDLEAGMYTVTVTDENGCSATATYTVDEPASLEIVLGEINDVDCNGNETGSIVVTTTGGSPGYTYSWSNGATTNTNTDLEAGMYTVTVTDENGCSATATYTVDEPASLEIVLGEINDVDCNGNDTGSIVVTTTGGSPGYTYSWSNGATTNTNTDLEAGMYTVTVTDENGCSTTATYTVDEPASLEIVLGEINDVDCNGNDTGSIVVTTTGGSPGYTYSWSNGATTNTNTDLEAGMYTVTVTDENGCSTTATYTVDEAEPIQFEAIIENVECGSGATGSITLIDFSGGIGTYDVFWSNGETGTMITDLLSGNYTATVTDENNCQVEETFAVSQPGDIEINSVDIVENLCSQDENGAINLTVTGGFGNLNFTWSTGDTTSDVTSLENGVYTVTIEDENGCNLIESYTISSPEVLNAEAIEITDVSCNGEESGVISFLPTGGIAPYLIEWTYIPIDQSEPIIVVDENVTSIITQQFGAGSIDIKITDANGCLKEIESMSINEPQMLLYSDPSIVDVQCNGDTSGLISFIIEGGSNPYAVEWTYTPSDGEETYVEWTYNVTDTVEINFGSGNVTPKIIDNNGCELVGTVISLAEPIALGFEDLSTTDPTCFADTNGMVSLMPVGGASPYAIEWTYTPTGGTEVYVEWTYNVTDEASFNFPASTVYPVIIDDNGCELALDAIEITEPDALEINSVYLQDAICYGDTSGIIQFDIEGGIAPFLIEWTYIPIGSATSITFNQVSTDGSVSQLFPAGKVEAIIQDANECTVQIDAQTISVKNEITIEKFEIQDPKCGVDSSGIVMLQLAGGASPYAVEWTYTPTNGSETFVEWTYNITDLVEFNFGPGVLSALVEDANGCAFSIQEFILEDVGGTEIKEIKVTYSGGLGNILLELEDNGGDITFQWMGPDDFVSSAQNLTGLKPGVYSCVITDENGCQTLTGNIEIIITSVENINETDQFEVNTLVRNNLILKHSSDEHYTIKCIGVQGMIYHESESQFGDYTIDMSSYPSGIYIIAIYDGQSVFSQLISKI